MSTGDHLRAATHHARNYADWKRVEAGATLGMKANDEHARAIGANMMGNPSGAHAHEARAHLAAAAADAFAPSVPPLPPHRHVSPPPLLPHQHHEVEVLPARIVVDEPPSPLSGDVVVVNESRSPVVHVAPPVPMHALPPPVAAPFVPPPPRVRMRDALRDVVNSKVRQGEAFMARKATQQHTMAMHSGALGLPDKAHQHEAKAHLAGAVASVLHRPHYPPRSMHPAIVPPSPVVVQSPIYTSP